MRKLIQSVKAITTGVVLSVYTTAPALADDIEIYTTLGNAVTADLQPNILFILDSSGSMNDPVGAPVPTPYNAATTYSGDYEDDVIYYSETGEPPATNSKNYFNLTAFHCDHAWKEYGFDADGDEVILTDADGDPNPGPLLTSGYYNAQIAQKRSNNVWNTMYVRNNTDRARPVECKQDAGFHGENDTPTPKVHIDDSNAGWQTAVSTPSVWGGGGSNYTVYHSNYLNYLTDDTVTTTTTSTRFEELQASIMALTDANSSINIALMKFDEGDSEGGTIEYQMEDINAARNDFQARVRNMHTGGFTPLAETYYEALRYYGAQSVEYGTASIGFAFESGTGNTIYENPITGECQKNNIIFLSDGSPSKDHISDAQVASLPGFTETSCADNGLLDTRASNVSNSCLEFFAGWAKNNDVARRADITAHAGEQNITTYTVGFDFSTGSADEIAAQDLLRRTARAGGGDYYEANDSGTLSTVFNKIIAEILAVNTTFSSPAVSVNAFNRSTHLDDLYFTLFKPAVGNHWNGNLKKYKIKMLTDGTPFVADKNDDAAVDANSGFFSDEAVSFWTADADAPDGGEAAKGGAASKLIYGAGRNSYTFTGAYVDSGGVSTPAASTGVLTASTNELDVGNALITDTMLGGVAANATVDVNGTATAYRTALLEWATGKDVLDDDGDNVYAEARRVMGDPLHSEPALVQYGGTDAAPDLVSYVATNDGYLHAFDADDGAELWAFVPQELLQNLEPLFDDTGMGGKTYGIDGSVVAWINDADKDGIVESSDGEHVYLYFGMRRGGSSIYSMDVTDRNAPTLRWKIDGDTASSVYEEIGETWSTINVENIKVGNASRKVLIIGGGYDNAQDGATTRATDTDGRGVFIIDATTGALLWRAGPDSDANLQLTDMNYSIPSRVKPLDINGDSFIDRLYVGDMGGQLWRFDLAPSTAATYSTAGSDVVTELETLVTGGRIANFATDSSTADNRRFYYPPDVAFIVEEGQGAYLSILAASGFRAHPLQTATHDRIFMMRDKDIYEAPLVDTDGDDVPDTIGYTTITEADLYDATDNLVTEGSGGDATVAGSRANAIAELADSQGWYIDLDDEDTGTFLGEKSLSEPLIFANTAIVTTFSPSDAGAPLKTSCRPNEGTAAIFYINIADGTPTYSSDDELGIRENRKKWLKRGGIPPSPSIIITEDGAPTMCVGTECASASTNLNITKTYWYEIENAAATVTP